MKIQYLKILTIIFLLITLCGCQTTHIKPQQSCASVSIDILGKEQTKCIDVHSLERDSLLKRVKEDHTKVSDTEKYDIEIKYLNCVSSAHAEYTNPIFSCISQSSKNWANAQAAKYKNEAKYYEERKEADIKYSKVWKLFKQGKITVFEREMLLK